MASIKKHMQIHSKIAAAVRNCNLVFFIGAGFSKPLGLPNWTDLVKLITTDLVKDYPDDVYIKTAVEQISQKYLTEIEVLDKLKARHHLPRMLEILKEKVDIDLGTKNLDRHKKLWTITDQVITTNYDKALEHVAPARIDKVVHEDDFHIAQLAHAERFLYKVHGTIEQPAKCIMFSDQYEKLYDRDTGASIELFNMLSGKTVIFIGFSLADPFVNELLSLRQKAYAGLKQHHFIITTDGGDFSALGVELISAVKNYGEDMDAFLDALIEIRKENPCGLGSLIQGLRRDGQIVDEAIAREKYRELLKYFEEDPAATEMAEQMKAGEFENVEANLKIVVDQAEASLQQQQQDLAEKVFKLASLKNMQVKYDEALPYYERALELVPNHLLYRNYVGMSLISKGKYHEAKACFQAGLPQLETTENLDASLLSSFYNNLGLALANIGDNSEAIGFFEKAIHIATTRLGDTCEIIGTFNNNIGLALLNSKNFEKAFTFFNTALDFDLKTFGDKDATVARDYNNIGLSLFYMGSKEKEALDFYDKALSILLPVAEENLTPAVTANSPLIATIYSNKGAAWEQLNEHETAIGFYEQALAIDLAIFGEQHPDTARVYNNFAFIYVKQGKYADAIRLYEKALPVYVQEKGADHPDTLIMEQGLSLARAQLAAQLNPPPEADKTQPDTSE
jgi:tetratricopeptide (TPR) repeat protein